MVGAMLVGAWILIHQQCCVTGEIDSRSHSLLFDPLIRRSALEKNFMRYGRSLLSKEIEFNRNEETRVKINFSESTTPDFSLGSSLEEDIAPKDKKSKQMKSSPMSVKEDESKIDAFSRPRRKDKSFIRFGRNNANDFDRLSRAADQFLRFGRKKDMFIRFGKDLLHKASAKRNSNFLRLGKRDENFLRFGRVKDKLMALNSPFEFFDLNHKGNERFINQRLKRSVDENFYHSSRDKEAMRFSRQKQMDKDGFIRFGRSIRTNDGKVPRDFCERIKSESFYEDYCLKALDPNFLIMQDFSLLQQILVKLTLGAQPLKKLIRFKY